MRNDVWCPNCQQLVSPVVESDQVTRLIAGGAILGAAGGAYWLTSLVQSIDSAVIAAVFAGIIAVAYVQKYVGKPRCPICKSRNLGEHAPTA